MDDLAKARIGIAGLGGIGSNVALMLARAGVGTLVLADFDTVDPTNINRQVYLPRHIGRSKADALVDMLGTICPEIRLEAHEARVTPDNAARMFRGCQVVCEAFDDPGQKAMLVETLIPEGFTVVGCSGMAGIGPANAISTRKVLPHLYLCGDGESDVADERLNAARVSVCAGHVAMAATRLVLGLEP